MYLSWVMELHQPRRAPPASRPGRRCPVVDKAIVNAHTTAISEATECLAAHPGYSRVHNPVTGEKLLVRLPLCDTSV